MNAAKMKAIMALIDDMDENMLGDIKSKMSDKMDMPEMGKPDVKITKVAVIPKKEMEDSEEEDNEDKSTLEGILPKEGDEEDPLAKLRKKFAGK